MADLIVTDALLARFWTLVDRRGPDECWPFRSAVKRGGYGSFHKCVASRFSWIAAHGPIPPGLMACHKCDYPPCVNPAHLFLGTGLDNSLDAARKGRKNKPGDLTDDQVREIRRRWNGGELCADLAIEYGRSKGVINHIVHYIKRPTVDPRPPRRPSWELFAEAMATLEGRA